MTGDATGHGPIASPKLDLLGLGRPPEISEEEVIARIRTKMPDVLRLTLDSWKPQINALVYSCMG